MTTRKLVLLIAFLGGSFLTSAQYNDFGVWASTRVDQPLLKNLNGNLELACRTGNLATEAQSIFTDAAMEYRLLKQVRIGGNYRYGARLHEDGYYTFRQRFAVDLRLKEEIGDINVGYRFRFQATNNSLGQNEDGIEFRNSYRHKLSASTKLMKKTWVNCAGEVWTSVRDEQMMMSDLRIKLGYKRKLKKRKYYSAGFLFQTELNSGDPLREYVIYLTLDFERKKPGWMKKKD